MNTHTAGTGLGWIGRACAYLLAVATVAGCDDADKPPLVGDAIRPVKTLVVSAPAPGTGAGIELPAQVRAARQTNLAFQEVGGQIVELPISGREGREVRKGELLAQIDPTGFEAALRSAEGSLGDAYSVLSLARAENERLEKMKGITPDLVSASMMERTRERLSQAQVRIDTLEAEVEKAEGLLEYSSLRAPFAAIVIRRLVENGQQVRADEPIVSLQDVAHLEVLVDAPAPTVEAALALRPEALSALARFPPAPGKEFPLTLKEATGSEDPVTGARRMVLEMPKPKGIDLPTGTTGTVTLDGEAPGMGAEPVLVPAIAVVTDPDGRDYVWLVNEMELRVRRRDIRVGRLAGSDRIQVLSGLTGGERIVVAGVMHLAEGKQVRLWEDGAAGQAR